jgi:hypothetical protein
MSPLIIAGCCSPRPNWGLLAAVIDNAIVVEERDGSAQQRLYDAAAGWTANPGFGAAELIDAACQALVEGLDSAALRELAPCSAHRCGWGGVAC